MEQSPSPYRFRHDVSSLGALLELSPTEFELIVADLLSAIGYTNVPRVGGAGDLAADITCSDAAGHHVAVQCKRYAPGVAVGSPAIQHFIGMAFVHHAADSGIFVTTARFGKQAKDLAERHRIELLDGETLVERFRQVSSGEVARAGQGPVLFTAPTLNGSLRVFADGVELEDAGWREFLPIDQIWGVDVKKRFLAPAVRFDITTFDRRTISLSFRANADYEAARRAIVAECRDDGRMGPR